VNHSSIIVPTDRDYSDYTVVPNYLSNLINVSLDNLYKI